jgi:hypothetical protein
MEICVRDRLFIPRRNADVLRLGTSYRITEMHTFLVTLIRQFEFALPDDSPKVKRQRSGLVVPVVEGEEHKGVQLSLKLTPLGNE